LCCPWCAHVLLWSFLFFFFVRDQFILVHAIWALLYLCIHWSVQQKLYVYPKVFFVIYLKKKVVFVRKKLSLWGSNSRHSHYSMTLNHTETAPVYHGEPKANKQAFNSAQTSWEHDYVGLALVHPNYGVYSWVEILSNLRWSSPGMMHGSVGRSLAWQDDQPLPARSLSSIESWTCCTSSPHRVRSWT